MKPTGYGYETVNFGGDEVKGQGNAEVGHKNGEMAYLEDYPRNSNQTWQTHMVDAYCVRTSRMQKVKLGLC